MTDHPVCLNPNLKKREGKKKKRKTPVFCSWLFLSMLQCHSLGSQTLCGEASSLPGVSVLFCTTFRQKLQKHTCPWKSSLLPQTDGVFPFAACGHAFPSSPPVFPLSPVTPQGLSWNHLLPLIICDLNLSRHEMLI